MSKQTSIEWLIDQMLKQGYFDGNKPLSITNLDHLQQEAKQMHKEEIKSAYLQGGTDVHCKKYKGMHEYHQETYGTDTN